jgi:hypothetical protein
MKAILYPISLVFQRKSELLLRMLCNSDSAVEKSV